MFKVYASYFVSYLLLNLEEKERIENIILFGSVAKGEADEDSDVDIFVKVDKRSKKLEEKIEKILSSFYESREGLLFRNKGIDNKINIIIGRLEEWEELKESIDSTGIVLYGKYVPTDVKGKKYVIVFWDKIGKNRGAFLNKIYGFRSNGKKYEGLIDKFNGRKLGKSCIMVPIEYRDKINKLLKKYEVSAKMVEVYGE